MGRELGQEKGMGIFRSKFLNIPKHLDLEYSKKNPKRLPKCFGVF